MFFLIDHFDNKNKYLNNNSDYINYIIKISRTNINNLQHYDNHFLIPVIFNKYVKKKNPRKYYIKYKKFEYMNYYFYNNQKII